MRKLSTFITYLTIFFVLLIVATLIPGLQSIIGVTGPLLTAIAAFAAILGFEKWADFTPYVKKFAEWLPGKLVFQAAFILFLTIPSAVYASLIVFCYAEKILYVRSLENLAHAFYSGRQDDATAAVLQSTFEKFPTRVEIPFLVSSKVIDLRTSHEETKFREFDRFVLRSLSGRNPTDPNGSPFIDKNKMQSSWLRGMCLCSDESKGYDISLLLARLAAEGYKGQLPGTENIVLASKILKPVNETPLRLLYEKIAKLDILLSAQPQHSNPAENTRKKWSDIDDITRQIRQVIYDNISSRHFKQSDILQQAWDYLAQVELERCSLQENEKDDKLRIIRFHDINTAFEQLLRIRTEVLQSRSSTDEVVWTFPPEKFLLFWHVVKLKGANIPVDFVRADLDRWQKSCPGYLDELKKMLDANFGPFTGSSYVQEWKKGTVAHGSIDPSSETYILRESIKNGWRF